MEGFPHLRLRSGGEEGGLLCGAATEMGVGENLNAHDYCGNDVAP